MIVAKVESEPFALLPPAPTVIGYVCAVSVIPPGAFAGLVENESPGSLPIL